MGWHMRFVRRPTALPDWYHPSDPEDPGSYDLRFAGMFEVAAGMAAAGLLHEAAAPPLPRWPPDGIGRERADELAQYMFEPAEPDEAELDDVLEPHERPTVSEFITRFEAATGQPGPPGKALAYKFRSNGGWLVTPDECRSIADGLDAALTGDRAGLLAGMRDRGYRHTCESVWDLLSWWAQYNRMAADHGGYRVW